MSFYEELEAKIATAMQADRHRLRNLLRAVRQAEQQGRPPDERLDRLLAQLDESNRRREARQALVPRLIYDESLPVVVRREEIAAAIRGHQVVVVSGETGSGKSTQLPKICLEIGRGVAGLIGHTQPRRIAARSIATRLGEELGTSVGQKVGFKIRFTDATSPQTLIKVMTDGVLLAESQHDRYFDQYDTLIIDEAHERSLNIDFLLGYLKRLLPQRPDLRLIITSATIDAQRFAEHFVGAGEPTPVIEVTGRTYPVEVLYRPLFDLAREDDDIDPIRGVADAVEEICRLGGGDVLVFLPTERDILEAAHKLRGRNLPGGKPDILPLYARLSTAEQNRVFAPHSGRRIVLATNVAESSLTVPGIRYVVDTGTARVSRYSARSKVQRLPIEAVSQASADQRKGRCGRLGPGVCIRLFSEEDFQGRDRFTSPEIQRTNLAAVILQLLAHGLGTIDEFPFLDPPRPEAIRDGYRDLFELGAIDGERRLTPIGRQLARLPVDPRIGRMIVEADREGCLADVLIVAAALEVQDPRDRPVDRQQEADAAHARWADPASDFIAWLRLWDFVQQLKQQTSRGAFRKACRQHFLSEVRLREWHDVHRQLLDMAQQSGLKGGRRRWLAGTKPGPGSPGASLLPANEHDLDAYAAIHRALLAGLLSSVAQRGDTAEYTAAGGGKFLLWPGSGVFGIKPKWVVAAELVETTRRYIRTIGKIDPDWIEPLASHLVARSYSEPHWDRKAGGAMAYEKVSLWGLTIVARRRVRYTAIDPAASRELLIQHGLVEGDLDTRAEFFRHNRELLSNLDKLASKTRQRGLIVEPHVLYRFFDARLPADVCDAPLLDKWLRAAGKENSRRLCLTEKDLLDGQATEDSAAAFPDQLQIDKLKLPLDYRFEPGAEQDGITLTVPAAGLAQLREDRLEWLIPGLLAEKIEAVVRSLPKTIRRTLGPAPDVARKVAEQLQFATGAFLPSVADALGRLAGQRISPETFALERLPPHLRINVRVIDEQGKTLREGRDLQELREQLGEQQVAEIAPAGTPWHQDQILKWDFGPLPPSIDLHRGGLVLTRYPALVDAGQSAALRLCETAAEAERQTRAGALRLFVLAEIRELKAQVKWLPQIEKIRLFAAPLCKTRSVDDELIDLLAARAFYPAEQVPRDAEAFEAQRLVGRKRTVPCVQELTGLALPLFETYHQVRLALDQAHPAAWQPAVEDLREQLAALLPAGFLTATPWPWLEQFPRYLKGMALRIKKLPSGAARDRQNQQQVARFWQEYRELSLAHQQRGTSDPELATFRWMIEELRVSLFAQELGTKTPISGPRLEKQLARVGN
ncbi:MAG: ATP-dependent RNA helicase HrpA [Pirellulaceae bacterium]